MSNKIFGERIRELREQRDLSMQELANFLEVSKSSVNMWENAGVVPREPILKKISQAFGVTIDYLLGNTTLEQEKERIDNLNDINVLFQEFLGNLSEEELEKFIKMLELMNLMDPNNKVDNLSSQLKSFYYAVKEAKKYDSIIGHIPTIEENVETWKMTKQYDELFSEEENNEN